MYFLDLLIAVSAGTLVGILVGRRNSRERQRRQELEAELAGVRAGATRYREEVAEHFTKTSELVHGLTLQYRAVYDHLADGARTLCPERMMELAQGDAAQALAAGTERAGDVEPSPAEAAAPVEEPADLAEAAADLALESRETQASAAAH